MTVAMIWVLEELNAPWWCYVATVGMFLLKCLYVVELREKK